MADERPCFRSKSLSYQVYHLVSEEKSHQERRNVALCGRREARDRSDVLTWGAVNPSCMRCERCRQIDERARLKREEHDA